MLQKRLTSDEASEILDSYYDRLWRCGTLPFYQYKRTYPDQAAHLPRTRACIIHDLTIVHARKEFAGVAGTRFIELSHPHTFLEIRERVLLRFKLLDESKDTSNQPTKFIQSFEQDAELPGIPPRAHRLTLGYRLNLLQTDVLDVWVTSRIGDRQFDIELYIPESKVVPIEEYEASFRQEKPRRRLVRAKVTEQRKLRKE